MLTDRSFPLGGDSLTHRKVNRTNNKNWTTYFYMPHHIVMRLKSDADAKRIVLKSARTLDFLQPLKGACCPTS
jgi:hypothetical protein